MLPAPIRRPSGPMLSAVMAAIPPDRPTPPFASVRACPFLPRPSAPLVPSWCRYWEVDLEAPDLQGVTDHRAEPMTGERSDRDGVSSTMSVERRVAEESGERADKRSARGDLPLADDREGGRRARRQTRRVLLRCGFCLFPVDVRVFYRAENPAQTSKTPPDVFGERSLAHRVPATQRFRQRPSS